jgi:hypothetical protein
MAAQCPSSRFQTARLTPAGMWRDRGVAGLSLRCRTESACVVVQQSLRRRRDCPCGSKTFGVLDPFPYADSDRLVNVIVRDASGKTVGSLFPAEEFLDYEEQTTVFEDVVGTKLQVAVCGTSDMGPARLNIAWMTPSGFAFFGVPALLGRTFGTGDAAPGLSSAPRRAWRRIACSSANYGTRHRTIL